MKRLNTLDRAAIETLAYGLEKHPGLIPLDRARIVATLDQAYVPDTSRFHEIVPENWQSLEESDRYHRFSLRRILRNKNARVYDPNLLKLTYATVISVFGGYSSDDMARRLRMDEHLARMMIDNDHPFSLLAKQETVDFTDHEAVYISKRPVLVIPGADMERVLKWESENTVYETEVGIFRRPKRIPPQRYLGH